MEYAAAGKAVGAELLADLLNRYGRHGAVREQLQHSHMLRHTMATRWPRGGLRSEDAAPPARARQHEDHASSTSAQSRRDDAEVLTFDAVPLPFDVDAERG